MKCGMLEIISLGLIAIILPNPTQAIPPTISGIPPLAIGDNENNIGADNNFFVFTNAFKFDDYARDPDTTVSILQWSFDEDDAPAGDTQGPLTQYFQVNGKNPVHVGAAELANDVSTTYASHVSPPTESELRSANRWASLRDIVFSPPLDSPPFPPPPGNFTTGTVNAHALGKMLRFYASDGVDVAHQDMLLKTIDNTSDTLTGGIAVTNFYDDDLSVPLGWSPLPQPSPLRSESTLHSQLNTSLNAIVGSDPVGNWATFGWITNVQSGSQPSQPINYAAVGTGNVVRARFFMFAEGQTGSALNQVPSLRMRVANRFAITAYLIIRSNLGSSKNNDALVQEIQPSKSPSSPSVYNVDLDPMDTPRMTNNRANESFLRAFEIYDNAPQANGTIAMTEAQIMTYPASLIADQGPQITSVTAATGLIKSWQGGDFGEGSQTTPLTPNWAGTIHKYYYNATETTGGQPLLSVSPSGVYMDTLSVESDRVGIVGYDMFGGTDEYPRTTATRQIAARVEPGKMYKVKFHATATVNANQQPVIRFRARTLAFDWTSTLEINGTAVGGNSSLIIREATPGIGNALPAADRIPGDTTGGWYNVLMSTPMDPNVRPAQPALALQDPPGVCTNAVSNNKSRRDIQVGVDIIDDFYGTQGSSETGQILIDRVQIHKLNQVN